MTAQNIDRWENATYIVLDSSTEESLDATMNYNTTGLTDSADILEIKHISLTQNWNNIIAGKNKLGISFFDENTETIKTDSINLSLGSLSLVELLDKLKTGLDTIMITHDINTYSFDVQFDMTAEKLIITNNKTIPWSIIFDTGSEHDTTIPKRYFGMKDLVLSRIIPQSKNFISARTPDTEPYGAVGLFLDDVIGGSGIEPDNVINSANIKATAFIPFGRRLNYSQPKNYNVSSLIYHRGADITHPANFMISWKKDYEDEEIEGFNSDYMINIYARDISKTPV